MTEDEHERFHDALAKVAELAVKLSAARAEIEQLQIDKRHLQHSNVAREDEIARLIGHDPGGSAWHSIDRHPDEPTQVELFFGSAAYEDEDARWPTDNRREIGYWDGKTWREMGSNHEWLEPWRDPETLPTHWRALDRAVPAGYR